MSTGRSDLNGRVKRWPGWAVLALVLAALFAVGVTRDSGPRTPEDRIVAIQKRLACPVCQGESVYESRNSASVQIRELIRQKVTEGSLTDQQIVDGIVDGPFEGVALLVPRSSGVDALAWVLPATAFVIGLVGLTFAFRRWQRGARTLGAATAADYALVEAAVAADRGSGTDGEQSDEHRS
jgi:cytochrome c-type biogenesis protein CcmH